MTLLSPLLVLFSLSTNADQSPPAAKTVYYAATGSNPARLIFLSSGISTTQNVIMTRTVDPNNSTIVEIACISSSKSPAELSPVYMQVSGNQITAMSDTPDFAHPKFLTGTG